METKKTHKEVKEAQIPITGLADYITASERRKRTVVQSYRYRPTIRVIQYNDGKAIGSNWLRAGAGDTKALRASAYRVRNKLADDDFDVSLNEGNADLLVRLADVFDSDGIELPKADFAPGLDLPSLTIAGIRVTMRVGMLLRRTTRTNKLKTGALIYRYQKGKPLKPTLGAATSAGILGFLKQSGTTENAEPEQRLCVTFCGTAVKAYSAPTNSVELWNEMKAACATIRDMWPNIPPPTGAVL